MNDFKQVKKNTKYQTKSKSGWTYHTHITPIDDTLLYNPLNDAFNQFLNNLKIEKEEITKKLQIQTPYRLIIRTEGDFDNINISGKVFQKSKFLINRKFKQKLIDYYNPIGIFVKGPNLTDISNKKYWIIELSPVYENNDLSQN